MANIITAPESGIYFDGNTAGYGDIPTLTGNASGVAIQYDGYAGIKINSSATGDNYQDRFSVEGANGRLFGVSDAVTGTVFSVNDAAGLPIIEVESTADYDKITIGEYGTDALVISGSSVEIGGETAATRDWVTGQGYVTASSEQQNLDNVLAKGNTSTRSMSVGAITGSNLTVGDSHFIGNQSTFDNLLLLSSAGENVVVSAANDIYLNTGGSSASSVGTTRLYISSSDGNVGVGTTSPDYKLDVAGDIGVDGYIYHNGDDSRIGFEGNDAIRMYTANSVRLQIQSNGNVGIGNTNPTSKLAVAGNIQSTAGGSWASNSGGVQLTYDGTDTGILSMYYDDQNLVLGAGVTQQNNITINGHTSDNNITFKVANSERMRILSSGQLIVGGTAFGYAGTDLQVGNTSDSQNGLNIITSTTGYGYILFGDALATADSYVGQISYKHGDDYMAFRTAGTEKLRIDSSGNIGINDTTPSYKLDVNGTLRSTGQALFQHGDSTSGLSTALSAIFGTQGTQAGAIKLESRSNASNYSLIQHTDTNTHIDNVGGQLYLNWYDGDSIYVHTDSRILRNGNWGVGTTSPGYKLDVNGTLRTTGNAYFNSQVEIGTSLNMTDGDIQNAYNINGNFFNQRASGIPRNNLGSPTVTEMALFDSQFTCKTDLSNSYNDLSDLTFWVQATSSDEWTEVTTYSDDQKRKFLRTNNSSVIIPNLSYKYRVEFNASYYTYANALYMYWSSNSHNTQVHIWKYNVLNDAWTQHTSSTNTVSSWPGHLWLPFNTIPWHETHTTSSSHYKKIRIEFTPNWQTSNPTYSDRDINLYGGQIWGGYPTGRRTPHYYDQNGLLNTWGAFSISTIAAATSDLDKFLVSDSGTVKYRTGAQVKSDIGLGSAENTALSTWAGSTNITTLGTIGTGTWQGSVIASAYLDADTAHLSGTQTFSGAKTFSSGTTLARPVLVNGAHDNGGKADFAVDGGTQISLYDGQVQMGGSDMNWNAKFYYDSTYGTHIGAWDNNITIFSTGTNSGTAAARDIIFKPQISGTAAATERMRIKGNGNVGIGTATPAAKLDVNGAITNSSGNVRIESVSGQEVEIASTRDIRLLIDSNNDDTTNRFEIQSNTSTSNDSNIVFVVEQDGQTIIDGGVGVASSGTLHLRQKGNSESDGLAITSSSTTSHRIWKDASGKLNIGPSSDSDAFVQDLSGNVGIGTTSPASELHVTGGIGAYTSDYATGTTGSRLLMKPFATTGDTYSFIQAQDVGGTSNNALVLQPYGDNVGIGTTSPSAKLEVAKGGEGEYLRVGGDNAAGGRALTFTSGSNNGSVGALHTINAISTNGEIAFATANTERMRITSSGNVGIGTTSPTFNLDIYEDSSDTVPMIKLRQDGVGDASLGFNIIGSTQASIGLDNSDGDKFKISRSESLGSATQLTIDSSGNVGIGTDNPDKKLVVSGTDSEIVINDTSYTPLLRFRNAGSTSGYILMNSSEHMQIHTGGTSEAVRIQANGHVGIGTTSPGERLHVGGDIRVGVGGASDYNRVEFTRYGGSVVGAIGWHTDANFYVAGHPSYGPTAGNDVRVYGFGSDLHLGDNTNGDVLTVQASSGNVGIGTTSPSTELDVAGDISADGVITTGGTATAEVGSWLHVGRQWSFSGLPFFNATSGSTAQRLDGAFMTDLNTGTAASRRAQAVFGGAFNDISGYSGAGTDYSRALGASIKAGFFITGQDSAKVIFAVGLASTSGVYADADPISNYGFGVEFRRGSGSVYEWRVFGHNGTTLTASSWSSSGITYSVDPRTIAIYSDGSGNITAYTAMYGDTNYTTITTTGGPTATSGTSTSTNLVGLRCNTNASGYVTGAYAKARASAVNFYAE